MPNHYSNLNSEKALIWRIVHRDNLAWILDNGLHCGNSGIRSANWVDIGNPELIDKRSNHPVPLPPAGVLGDYVPFYFTPFSVMMMNIHSGRGVIQRKNKEIVILVSSIPKIKKKGLDYVFTDGHAYCQWADFYNDDKDLNKIDWSILQRRDFARDPDDPAKLDRYQAEALIHQSCPVSSLLGIVCYTESMKNSIEKLLKKRGLKLKVYARKEWYF